MKKYLAIALLVLIGSMFVGCDQSVLTEDNYAEIWEATFDAYCEDIGINKPVDDPARYTNWEAALREYGTSKAEYDAFTRQLIWESDEGTWGATIGTLLGNGETHSEIQFFLYMLLIETEARAAELTTQ